MVRFTNIIKALCVGDVYKYTHIHTVYILKARMKLERMGLCAYFISFH